MKYYFLGLFLIFLFSILIFQGIYLPKTSFAPEKPFQIQKGQGFLEISKNLEREGLIKNKIYFNLYVFFTGNYKKFQTGEYLLSESMNIAQITKKLVSGETIKEKITIIEGWNLRDIGWYFENKGLAQAEELFEIVGFPLVDYSKVTDLPEPEDFSTDFDFLKDKPKNVSLEGYLFPDTYYIRRQKTREEKGEIGDIVRKMLKNFDRKLNQDLKEEIERQGKTIFEIVTMASMLEKEVRTLEDKKLVSGILWKRLENQIPLQVDATITYITGKKTVKVSKEETKIDSPYNTYKYKGLPLGPICNPGLESIIAAIYPKKSEYWYYLSIPSGETIFSQTLQEHNLAKVKYLR